MLLPNGSRLSCGRLPRRRKGRGRQSVPARAQHSASLRAINARQLQALVRRQPTPRSSHRASTACMAALRPSGSGAVVLIGPDTKTSPACVTKASFLVGGIAVDQNVWYTTSVIWENGTWPVLTLNNRRRVQWTVRSAGSKTKKVSSSPAPKAAARLAPTKPQVNQVLSHRFAPMQPRTAWRARATANARQPIRKPRWVSRRANEPSGRCSSVTLAVLPRLWLSNCRKTWRARLPPNESRLRCGAKFSHSQTEFYNTVRQHVNRHR